MWINAMSRVAMQKGITIPELLKQQREKSLNLTSRTKTLKSRRRLFDRVFSKKGPDLFWADVRSTISSLDGIVAAITQTNSKLQSRLTSAFVTKLGALGVSGSAMGLLSLGTASTGTAIGALSGAAATKANCSGSVY